VVPDDDMLLLQIPSDAPDAALLMLKKILHIQ